MALGKAVVSTTLGAEGIDAQHEREILLADDAEGLANATVRVLADPVLGQRLGANARSLVVQRYSWRSSVDRLANFYAELGAAAN